MNKTQRSTIVFLILLILAACSPVKPPEVGTVLNIPADTEARQVRANRTGLDDTPCKLPAQEITIERNSYWQTFIGSTEGASMTYLSEVTVSDTGNCDKMRKVFIEDEILIKLIEEESE